MRRLAAGLLGIIGLLPASLWAEVAPDSARIDSARIDSARIDSARTVAPSVFPPRTVSHWGPAAAVPGDTARAVLADAPRPLWESALVWPYRIATFPLALTAKGLGGAVQALDEERVLYRIGRFLAPRRGPFGVLVDVRAGGLSGFGGGVTLEHDAFFRAGNQFRLRAETTTRGDHQVLLGVRAPAAVGGDVEFGAGFRARPYARYFGLGPATQGSAESFYRQEAAWAGASFRRALGGGFSAQGDLLHSSILAGAPGSEESPAIETAHAGLLPIGYGGHTYGWSLGAQVAHESGRNRGRPAGGGLRRARVSRYLGVSSDRARFWAFRGEAQQYFTLFFPQRVLALRGVASWIEAGDIAEVPFQRLLTNDDPDLLRGYEDFRFRDRGLAILSAEYRWPFWVNEMADGAGLDLYLLSDAGQVFSRADRIGLRDMTLSYGAGIRIQSARGFLARVEIARSEEQTMFRLRADQIFQFAKGSLLHGRDPVPDR